VRERLRIVVFECPQRFLERKRAGVETRAIQQCIEGELLSTLPLAQGASSGDTDR